MNIIVIGAGSWGLTLAHILSKKNAVTVWTINNEIAQLLTREREDPRLPGLKINENVTFCTVFTSKFNPDTLFIIVTPSDQVESVCNHLKNYIKTPKILCASKGFDHNKFLTMSQLIQKTFPKSPIAALTGPTIAREVAQGQPTRAVLSSDKIWFLADLVKELENDYVTFELSTDIVGNEICACLKGIIAIGVGIADGLGLGKNMQGIIMTYGLKEFVEISEFLGASSKTIYGLSGMADLITTCISPDSRNRNLGYLLGQGYSLDDALKKVGMVVEGLNMEKTIFKLESVDVPIPLISEINKIIFNQRKNSDIYSSFISTIKKLKKK